MNEEQLFQGKALLQDIDIAKRRLMFLTNAEGKIPSVVIKIGTGESYVILNAEHQPEKVDTILLLCTSYWERRLKSLEQEFADL